MANNKESDMKYVVNKWVYGSFVLLYIISAVLFGYAQTKVSQQEYDKFEQRQCEINNKFDDTIKKNNDLLIEVKTILKERTE